MSLYDISFTTAMLVKKLDEKGRIVSEERLERPITMTALPHATAMSYAKCDNFQITAHLDEVQRRGSAKSRGVEWGAAATKKVDREAYARKESAKSKPLASKSPKLSAAETGDLAAAVNA